jgi:hypothetical protein
LVSGQHDGTWQPTDAQPGAPYSIAQRVAQPGLSKARVPLPLDVMAAQWRPDDARFDAVFCANMLHIAPWAARDCRHGMPCPPTTFFGSGPGDVMLTMNRRLYLHHLLQLSAVLWMPSGVLL